MHKRIASHARICTRCNGICSPLRSSRLITFTSNPAWDEIKQLLLPGQSQVDRHDITALMDFIVKYEVFGYVRCWMYSVEWQKRVLPHTHILIWLYNKITSDEIDDVIFAEIPRADVDKDLRELFSNRGF
ncbi:helitron_like_N domain-containing protein [Trichonephila inaurata madagascariensis]|uniref:Helitron_like_N domain-containing protein n=1 Tax=Trichonephila inaurata madagascariensis TaxID=2747483 RepID=A0A8X6Y5X6_9ARAC|nr:helitron_like_N domain-containing protein [Trichonephila inaurata madagascariensis]